MHLRWFGLVWQWQWQWSRWLKTKSSWLKMSPAHQLLGNSLGFLVFWGGKVISIISRPCGYMAKVSATYPPKSRTCAHLWIHPGFIPLRVCLPNSMSESQSSSHAFSSVSNWPGVSFANHWPKQQRSATHEIIWKLTNASLLCRFNNLHVLLDGVDWVKEVVDSTANHHPVEHLDKYFTTSTIFIATFFNS